MAVKQTCIVCEHKIEGEYRMRLMQGPKGYRQYAVHPGCAGGALKSKPGGRQMAKAKAQAAQAEGGKQKADVDPVCSLGYDTNKG